MVKYVWILAIAIPSVAWAQPTIPWYTIDGGGGTSSGGAVVLSGTIGQPDAGVVMSNGQVSLAGGFWPGATGTGSPPCPGRGPGACGPADWNEDGVVDFNDLLEFLNRYNTQDACADLNADGVIDFNDFLEYVNIYNAGC
jgi:hypothetical protein